MLNTHLPVGITASNVVHTRVDEFDVDTRFRMVKEAGVFDYIEKTPPPGEIESYQRASEKYQLPIRAGGFFYVCGRDESLLEWHLRVCRELGATVQNVQIRAIDADGQQVTNEQVAAAYLRAVEVGDRLGVTPCLEVHVNMWSEHFGRVERVGELVERRGAKFNITLDHSHVIFKIENRAEQDVQNLRKDIESGAVQLDPFKPGDVCTLWIERNWVRHAHARSTVPANPVNIWARHPDGTYGRGIQYPFVAPAAGQWHSEWHESKLEPWKEVIRRLLRFHASHVDSCLGQISNEFIPFTDYGAGAGYSEFEQAIACSKWIRQTWNEVVAAQTNYAMTSVRVGS